MTPSFEIYFCILTDAWMPWLEENRDDSRFEQILLSEDIPLRETSPAFFKGIYTAFKKHLNVCPASVLAEVKYLASVDRSPAAKKLAAGFLKLPAHSAREVFYNVITGQCLAGYCDWCSRLINNSGPDLPKYYLSQILNRLHHLLSVPGPEFPVAGAELGTVVNVKVALLALFQKLAEKYDEYVEGLHGFFNPEAWLNEYLQQINLPQQANDKALQLFRSLTERNAPAQMPQAVTYEHPAVRHPVEPSKDYSLEPIIRELEQEFSGMKEAVKMLAEEKKQHYPVYMGSREVMEFLKISKTTLKRYRDSGKIRCRKVEGKMLYSRSDIMNLLESRKK